MLTTEEKRRLFVASERIALRHLPIGVTQDDLINLRLDVGMDFVRLNFPDSYKRTIQSKGFWNFFRQVWHINDKGFGYAASHKGFHSIPWEVYERFHREKFLKYSLCKKVHRALLKEVKPSTKTATY